MNFYLLLALICLSECKILSVHPKYSKTKRPIQINGNFTQQSEENNRNKRSAFDDHGSDWSDKIKMKKSVLKDDAHTTAYVEWGGTDKSSDTIIVLTRDSEPTESTLYVSTDYGATFNSVSVTVDGRKAICSYVYQSPSNNKMFMLNDVSNKAVIVSYDEGKSWQTYMTDFTPSTIEHHPKVERLLLSHDRTTQKLYLSRDFGQSWTLIPADDKVVDFYWGTSQFDATNDIFLVTSNPDGTKRVVLSSNFFKTSKTVIADGVLEFSLVDDFYFYAKKSTHENHGDLDRDLFISYDRDPAVKAQFPPETLDNPSTEFFIADAGEGQAFVAVSHRDNMTHLYVTEHKGKNLVLSLERILFTNKASYEVVTWLDGIEPFVDLQPIEGLPGVFIASTLDVGEVGHRRIHTVMTFNKGGTWQYVQPPLYDQNGNPTQCFLPKCSLHISLFFGQKFRYQQHTPLLTKANAPGIIIASGNLGGSHSPINDLFISSDGGVEWSQVLEGQYNYQIADHGGIIVAASREPTTYILYSHDEGVTWYNKTISDVLITIYGLITEPGELTTVFNVYAIERDGGLEWVIFTIDFSDFLGPVCAQDDFMVWSIRDELKNTECVLGKDTKYERKKPTSHCKIGPDYQRFVEDKSCPCQATDFECDFLFERQSAGDPCTLVEGIPDEWFLPSDCKPGNKYNKTVGYIKIEGDQCQGGEEAFFSPKEVKCPDEALKNLTIVADPGLAVPIHSKIDFKVSTDSFVDDVHFMWFVDSKKVSYETGTKGTTFSHTFNEAGSYMISLTANNGAGPQVSVVVVEVDVPITGLVIQQEPQDPAVGEGVIFIVTTTDASTDVDISRLKYRWTTQDTNGSASMKSVLPMLLYTFDNAGPQTVSVTVSNSMDSVDLKTKFIVSDLTVTSLSCIPVSSTSIQVVWNPPTLRPGLVSAYTLKYTGPSMSSWHQMSLGLPTTSPNYRVVDLNPDTTYKFIMITTSSGGALSEESDTVSATTLPANTLAPAESVKARVNNREAEVRWSPPKSGSPTDYVVEYWMSDRPGIVKSHSTSGKTSLKLTDLTVGATYSIRVKTEFGADVAYSDVVDIQVEGTSPEEIKKLIGFPLNSTAVILLWETPQVDILGYHINNASDSGKVITTVTNSSATIGGLLPWTTYLFTVEPFTKTHTGQKSDIVNVTTDYGVPQAVKNLQCVIKDGKSQLTWHEPDRANGPIKGYLIDYEDSTLSTLNIPNHVTSNILAVVIEGLPEYLEFKFSVAVEGALANSSLAFTTCSTASSSGTPGPPSAVYVQSIGVSSVHLTWRPPAITHGDKLTYEIRYGRLSKGGTQLGTDMVMETSDLYATVRYGISPSTEYVFTVYAKNKKGTGAAAKSVIAATLTPDIGSIEYEFLFLTSDYKSVNSEDFVNSLVFKISQITKIAPSRLSGCGVTHQDDNDVKISIWVSPRQSADDSLAPSAETVVAALDSAVNNKQFTVSGITAQSGKMDHVAASSSSHHDVAEIIIPGICGLLVVLLVAGLLYYRNRYHQVVKRHAFRSRYANNDQEDVNMIECADDTGGMTSSDLRTGELSISNEDSTQKPRGIRNFFDRFNNNNNYTSVAQEDSDELVDDDEEHLLPL